MGDGHLRKPAAALGGHSPVENKAADRLDFVCCRRIKEEKDDDTEVIGVKMRSDLDGAGSGPRTPPCSMRTREVAVANTRTVPGEQASPLAQACIRLR